MDPRRWRPHAALPLVLALGAWLRLGRLETEHLFGDEAEYAIVARFLSNDLWALLYPSLTGPADAPFVSQPPLVLYLMGLSMRALGPTDLAAILPSALLGVASVAVVYAISWRLGGVLPALVSSILLAVLPFHVSMSRNAMLDVGYVFFVLLAALFLVLWLQDQRLWQAMAAGVAGACAALSKLPGMLVVAVLVVGVLMALLLALRRREWAQARRVTTHGLAMAAPLLLGGLLYLALLWRLDALEALWAKLEWNADRVAGGGSSQGLDYYFTAPHASFPALLGGSVFGLALAGGAFALFRGGQALASQPARIVLPVTTVVFAAFFLGSDRKIGFYLLPFAPLSALLVAELAAGLRDLVSWAGIRFTRADARRLGPLVAGFALVALAVPAYGAFDESYDEYGPTRDGSTYGYGFREAGAWIDAQGPEAGQYGSLLGRFTLRWYNDHETFHRFQNLTKLEQAAQDGRIVYVVFDAYSGEDETAAHLVSRFVGAPVRTVERDWGKVAVFQLQPDVLP